uniref:Uncharacterized protein n=1 Tax=Amphimedon queenslandica TaxID=400682 RepID=A0A1X7UZJ9_AMPQE
MKTKYDDILVMMRADMPADKTERPVKEYIHLRSEMTKAILSTKLKNIRQKYRQAVDSGRRSGHGSVVMLYYEICQSIWGGSPATEQIENGLESTELTNSATDTDDTTTSTVTDDLAAVASNESTEEDIIHRRNLLDKQLQEHRHSKLKRKLPVDVQLLACAQWS